MAAATASSSPRLHEQRGLAEDLAQGGRAAGDHGHAARHGLQRGQAEALVFGQEDRDVGGRVAHGQRGVVDEAGEADAAVQRQRRRTRRVEVEARAGCGSRPRRRAAGPASGGAGGRRRASSDGQRGAG